MSTIWLADDVTSGELAAIKPLDQEYSDNYEFRQCFQNEAATMRSTSGSNMVKITIYEKDDIGSHGACCIVMEYIHGESLPQVL